MLRHFSVRENVMNEKEIQQNTEEIEIDLQRIFSALLNKAWLIGIVSAVFLVASLVYTLLFVTPQYQSAATFYVNNSSMSFGTPST